MKTIEIKAADGYLNLAQRNFIDYLKNHKFRIFPKLIKVRISYCLPTISVWIKSSLTTKYIISEEAKRAYCNGDEKLYNELSDF